MKLKAWLLFRLQFSLALLVAAVFSVNKPKMALKQGWKVVTLWFGILPRGEKLVSEEIFEARMATCRKCPIFAPGLSTCGTPFRKLKEDRALGCKCFLKAKNQLRSSRCWLHEVGSSTWGWHPDLEFLDD